MKSDQIIKYCMTIFIITNLVVMSLSIGIGFLLAVGVLSGQQQTHVTREILPIQTIKEPVIFRDTSNYILFRDNQEVTQREIDYMNAVLNTE